MQTPLKVSATSTQVLNYDSLTSVSLNLYLSNLISIDLFITHNSLFSQGLSYVRFCPLEQELMGFLLVVHSKILGLLS